MKTSLSSVRRLSAGALLVASFSAGAAILDLVPDAVLGKATFTSPDSSTASAANLYRPVAIAVDPVTDELWVAEGTYNRVLRYASASAFANGEAANLVLGQPDFTSTAANRGGSTAADSLYLPVAVAVDQAGRVYVADMNNHRVLVYRPPLATGMAATWVIGQANFTANTRDRGGVTAANGFYTPQGVAVDGVGNLYVADTYNHRVLKFGAPAVTGASATKVFGQAGFTSNAAALTAAGLKFPRQATVDRAGNLWIVDGGHHRVLRYDLGGEGGDTTADLVLCQPVFTTDAAATQPNACYIPTGVMVSHDGAAYVADSGNHRVLVFDSPVTGALASAVIGQVDMYTGVCNRGAGSPSASTLCTPVPGAWDPGGHLLVSDQGNGRILRFDVPRNLAAPSMAGTSPALVAQGGGSFTLTVNGSGFYRGSVVNVNGSPRATQYLSPGRLLAQVLAADIAVAGPHAVTVANPAPGGGTSSLANLETHARSVLDATADAVLGQRDFTRAIEFDAAIGEERLGALNAAVLGWNDIHGLAIDAATGRIFLADATNSRVLSWPGIGSLRNAQPADIVIGQRDEFTGACNAGGIGAATLCQPYGVAVDASGALWVADTANNRVLQFLPPLATGMVASRVFGQGGSFITAFENNGGVSANSLRYPRSVLAGGDRLFVDDSGNYRILVFDSPAANFTADIVIGQSSMTANAGAPSSASRFSAGDGALAMDADGALWVACGSENRVLRFAPPFANGMAADLVLGQSSFSTAAYATSATGLGYPVGLAFDPGGNLLVSDNGNHRVLRYQAPLSSGMAAKDVIGQPDLVTGACGTAATALCGPWGIATDRVGNLAVADFSNARVLGFDRPFAFILDPVKDLDGDGIPNGVEVTESRDPYVKDNDVFGSARLFAMQQYRDFLNREGDEPGIAGWTNLVGSGSYSRLQAIDAFLSSDEFAGFVSPVVRLYFATFLRVPDYDGLTFNAGLVRAGSVTLTQLADFFTASPEFAATYGALDNTQFVTLLYANVLGRAPDPAGLAGWVGLLNSGYTRGQVLLGFSDSVEYQAAMANEVFVTMMYAGMLRRTPEPAGFNGWVGFLDAATYTREQVINGFFLSAEYASRFLP